MQTLIRNNTLRLACVDEVHQFVMFGCTFRPMFGLLKQSLFNYLTYDNNNSTSSTTSRLRVRLKVPLLLTTTAFNVELLNMLHSMIGTRVSPEMFLWSGRDAMHR